MRRASGTDVGKWMITRCTRYLNTFQIDCLGVDVVYSLLCVCVCMWRKSLLLPRCHMQRKADACNSNGKKSERGLVVACKDIF